MHAAVNDPTWVGPEELDPRMRLLSEGPQGALAERLAVPAGNLVPKPAELSFEEAACLPTAWLTAYRMLFTRGELAPGATVLVQGASGGLSSALITLGVAAGLRVWVTGRDEAKRAFAEELGAHATFEPGARLPERVDAVMDSVGAPTFKHSLASLRPGGVLVNSGATGGRTGEVELGRLFRLNLRIAGTTMGTREELAQADPLLRRAGPAAGDRHGRRARRRPRAGRPDGRPATCAGRSSSSPDASWGADQRTDVKFQSQVVL